MSCKGLLVSCLLLVNTAQAEICETCLEDTCLQAPCPNPVGHKIATLEDYAPILMDRHGKQIFTCPDCPKKFCKEFSCTMSIDQETRKQKGDCKCID